MRNRFLFQGLALLTAACFLAVPRIALRGAEPVDYVDTMIGTGNGGNTFPRPSLPNGFVKLSPDTDVKRAGGYDPTGKIRPFSRSEKHTPELQSPDHLPCPLLL